MAHMSDNDESMARMSVNDEFPSGNFVTVRN